MCISPPIQPHRKELAPSFYLEILVPFSSRHCRLSSILLLQLMRTPPHTPPPPGQMILLLAFRNNFTKCCLTVDVQFMGGRGRKRLAGEVDGSRFNLSSLVEEKRGGKSKSFELQKLNTRIMQNVIMPTEIIRLKGNVSCVCSITQRKRGR